MVTYDCIHHFEPKTARPLSSPFDSPESVFMFQDTLVIFDHLYQNLKLVSHVFLPPSSSPITSDSISSLYNAAVDRVHDLARKVLSDETPLPVQPPIIPNQKFTSNVGKEGYETFVTKLKQHIVKGDIIQAVPSQRLSRPTSLHPFNAYRQLRSVNPSPYMFYVDFGDLQLVGASPETLCKVEKRKVYNHAIAGTVKRGKNSEGAYVSFLNVDTMDRELIASRICSCSINQKHRGRHPRSRSPRFSKRSSRAYHARRSRSKRRQQGLSTFDRPGR